MRDLPQLRRTSITWYAGLIAMTVSACGSSPAAPPPAASATDSVPHTATAGSDPHQWVQQFCGKSQQDAELYVSSLGVATAATAAQSTARELRDTRQILYDTVHNGLDIPMAANANQLTTATTQGVDDATRTDLLGIYQRLHKALDTQEHRITSLPTTPTNQFVAAFSDVANAVVAATEASKAEVASHPTLGPIYTAEPNCR